jgi:protein-S-isoprenylcysteine O-methyltransferase Ste14
MWPTARLIAFAAGTCGLVYVSRKCLLKPRTHGFFRFFVFEFILTLGLLNLPVWLSDPTSWHQLVSWLLLTASLVPLLMGVRDLKKHGQADPGRRSDPELFEFERTSRLVSSGIFRYIRHPLYTSLLLLAWGVFFKSPSAIGALLSGAATVGVTVMARLDESECLRAFGDEYREYMQHTKRFVPHVI